MASARQIAANRKNAQKSTGPKTEAGKNASKRNAVKHGLAGAELLAPDDQAALLERIDAWRTSYRIDTPDQEWLFHQIVIASIRLDRCHQQEADIRLDQSRRATLCWDDDRRLQAEELATRLPRHPGVVSKRLEHTRQGVDWLIERWRVLGDIFERNGEWTEAQTSMVHDLIGTDPAIRNDLEPFAFPAEMVAREIERLERRKSHALEDLDEIERSASERNVEIHPSRALRNLRRYEKECLRVLLWATNLLNLSRVGTPGPAPTPPPPPSPPLPPPPSPPSQETPEAEVEPALIFSPPTARFAPAVSTAPSSLSPPSNRRARRAAAKLAAKRRRCA